MSKEKAIYIKTIIVFVLLAVLLFGVFYGKYRIDSSLKNFVYQTEQAVKTNHSNLDFVRNGLDLSGLNNDFSRLNTAIADLNTILKPYAEELGIPRFVYNAALDGVAKQIQVSTNVIGNTANSFTDENNVLTDYSFLNSLRLRIMKVVNIIAIVITVILVIIFGKIIITSLLAAAKARKARVTTV